MDHYFSLVRKYLGTLEALALALFVLFMPLISRVNFMQNDDWNRISSVARFMHGDFSLLPVTATTFYTQGILGTLFALVFGFSRLPYLTLLFSVANYYLFARVMHNYFRLSKLLSTLLSLVLFFNPLNSYSTIGFMTESYMLFFMLLGVYFFLHFEATNKFRDLLISSISGILAFFAKQSGVIFFVATIPYFIFKKRFKLAAFQTLILILLGAYYYFLFPQTTEMHAKGFILKNLLTANYAYSLIYGILLMVVAYTLPLVWTFIISTYITYKKHLLLFVFGAIFLFGSLNTLYKPGKIAWEEFPYFENTFERTGFLPRTVWGTKYQFKYNFKLYTYWDLLAKISLALLLPCLLAYGKRLVNVFSLSIFGYLVLMVFVETFFDRYILPLIPMFLLFLIYLKLPDQKYLTTALSIVTGLYVLFIAFFSTQLAYDFVYTHNFIWSRANKLVKSAEAKPSQIRATGAWVRYYSLQEDPTYATGFNYIFTYDSFKKNPDLKNDYDLIDAYKPKYFGNIFIDPAVYLYKKKL